MHANGLTIKTLVEVNIMYAVTCISMMNTQILRETSNTLK